MSYSNAIEGDFIETCDGLIFDVKGFKHPSDRIIAYLRYMSLKFLINRVEDSDIKLRLKQLSNSKDLKGISNYIEEKFSIKVNDVRLRNSTEIYLKLYNLQTRHRILMKFGDEYIFHHRNFDFPLQAVPVGNISKIYCPEQYLFNYLQNGKGEENQDSTIKTFIKYLIAQIDLNLEDIGISGSKMVNLENKGESDLDIIVYGYEQSKKVHDFIKKIILRIKTTPLEINGLKFDAYRNSKDFLKKLYANRDPNHNLSFKEFCNLENRKFHHFILNKSDVFIRFLRYRRNNNPFQDNFELIKYNTVGRVLVKGEVIEDKDSIFTPVSYFIKLTDIRILSKSDEILNINEEFLNIPNLEIFSMRGKYTEHVKIGEKIMVEGKLEYIEGKNLNELNKKRFYRVVVGEMKDFVQLITS